MGTASVPISEYVSASAGSGKTYGLSRRFADLIAAGAPPESVCALTFTRAAAREIFSAVMKRVLESDSEEVLKRMTEALPRLSVYTIDAFSVLLARLFAYELGVSPNLTLYDDASRPDGDNAGRAIVGRAMRTAPGQAPEEVLKQLDIDRAGEDHVGNLARELWAVLRKYQGLTRDTSPGDWGNVAAFGLRPLDDEERSRILDLLAASDFSMCTEAMRRKLLDAIAKYPGPQVPIRRFARSVSDAWFGENQFGALRNGSISTRSRTIDLGEGTKRLACLLWEDLRARDLAEAADHTAKLRRALNRLSEAREAFSETSGAVTFEELTERLGRMLGKTLSFTDPKLLDVCYRLNTKIRHLMIDEFQDTSTAQWRVLSNFAAELASGEDSTFYYVGDVKQSIYGWRGGDVTLFGDTTRLPPIPPGRPLNESRRSAPAIIDLINASMRFPKAALSGVSEWMEIALTAWRGTWCPHTAYNKERRGYAAVLTLEGKTKAEWFDCLVAYLVGRIRELRQSGRRLTIAILGFQNSLFVPDTTFGDDQGGDGLLDRLRKAGIACAIDGKRPIADTTLGRWMVTWLRWLDEPNASFSKALLCQTAPAEAFTPEAAAKWNRMLFESGAPICLERLIVDGVLCGFTEYDLEALEWIRNGLEAGERAGERNPGVLASRLEGMKMPCSADDNVVSLMTVHRSKGLTFDVVFSVFSGDILNLRQDDALETGEGWVIGQPTLPITRSVPKLRAARESRFLSRARDTLCCLYVGITRARHEQVVLVPAKEATQSGTRAGLFCLPLTAGRAAFREEPLSLKIPGGLIGYQPAKVIAEYGGKDWSATMPAEKGRGGAGAKPTGTWHCDGNTTSSETELPSESAKACTVFDMLTGGHGGAKRRGISYHDRLAGVGWTDHSPVFREVFIQPEEPCTLWRERPFVVSYTDPKGYAKRIAGQFDRVHIFNDYAVIYDFKTGASSEVTPAYRRQMEDYRYALTVLTGLPPEVIRTVLLFTRSETAVEVTQEALV